MSVSVIPYSARSSEFNVCMSQRIVVGKPPLAAVVYSSVANPLSLLDDTCDSSVAVNRLQRDAMDMIRLKTSRRMT